MCSFFDTCLGLKLLGISCLLPFSSMSFFSSFHMTELIYFENLIISFVYQPYRQGQTADRTNLKSGSWFDII
jgi:hypothetical protein